MTKDRFRLVRYHVEEKLARLINKEIEKMEGSGYYFKDKEVMPHSHESDEEGVVAVLLHFRKD